MEPNFKKQNSGQLNSIDRFSDLPDFIIHHIISFLGLKEAYRTSVLSKQWSRISATNPVLEFNHAVDLNYFETRMQRYRKENLRIKELSLVFSTKNVELKDKVDDWVEVAVRNQVSKFLIISDSIDYKLPAILFTAKTLTHLDCSDVRLPYYKAVDFASLESLKLQDVVLEEHMLDHIISSCRLLKELWVWVCKGIKNIAIPHSSLLETLEVETVSKGGAIVLENSTLKEFSYMPTNEEPWPIISKPGALRNLKTLFLSYVDVTDEGLAELLSEFALLESLVFWSCHKLNSMKISSTHVKDIRLNNCCSLLDILIDAPSLKKFKFKGELDPSMSISVTNNKPGCVISVHTLPFYLDTDGFVKLKMLLTGLNGRNFFKLSLLHESSEVICDDIEFDEELLGDFSLGLPCEVGELKLCFLPWILTESSLSSFVNALFWICHPEIVSLRIDLSASNLTVEAFISKLENMAKCWEHPLKRIQVEGTNSSSSPNRRKLYVRLRLFW